MPSQDHMTRRRATFGGLAAGLVPLAPKSSGDAGGDLPAEKGGFLADLQYGEGKDTAFLEHQREDASGFVTRSLREHLNDQAISLKEFGAKGDDRADDTAAIRTAVEYCSTSGKALYVPAGRYRHTALSFAPRLRAGLRIFGEWSYDYEPNRAGSFFIQNGAGYGMTFDGDSGPLYLLAEGVAWCGSIASAGGVRIVGRSSFGFRRCGWFNHANRAYPASGLLLTRNAEPFVGAMLLDDCWFANANKGIVLDKPLTNVVTITRTRFLDVSRCINIDAGGSARALNITESYFEGQNALSHALYVDGHIMTLDFSGNYIEQNSTNINEALIYLGQNKPDQVYTAISITNNFIQKQIGAPGEKIIYIDRARKVHIQNNTMAFGGMNDRYWVEVTETVEDAYIEQPATPNGVVPYPTYNRRTRRSYARTHWTGEDQLAGALEIKGAGDVARPENTARNTALFTEQQGEVRVDFDLTLSAVAGGNPRDAQIGGLPYVNGPVPVPVTIYMATGLDPSVMPLQGYLAGSSSAITLVGAQGAPIDYSTKLGRGARIRGRVVYMKA